MSPATDHERELERRVDELARLGYGIDLDRCVGHRVDVGEGGAGMPWRASLTRGSHRYPAGFGLTGEAALEDAVTLARGQGAV